MWKFIPLVANLGDEPSMHRFLGCDNGDSALIITSHPPATAYDRHVDSPGFNGPYLVK
jgi:hypothetical protein